MAVDVKKLIAAINPDVYCSRVPDEKFVPLHEIVKKLAKEQGILKAAEKAEIKESDYLDILHTQFTKGAFSLTGLKFPIESHQLVYDDFSQNLEPIYFWILDYVNKEYGKSTKLVDNFLSSPGGGHFAEMQTRVTRMQDEAMKIFGTINTVIRSILNIIYDLKEFKLRMDVYKDFHSGDEGLRNASLLSLKQIWMDNVDIKRGNGSINGLAQQLDFVTIRDAFMAAKSLKDLDNLDLNDRVKRILQQRVSEFERWLIESEKELNKRFEIEKIYLRSQVNSVKLYSRWLKPYLKAAQQLEQNAISDSGVINFFNTAVFELVLLAEGEYKMREDIAIGELPRSFMKMKLRKYIPINVIEFKFRSAPDRGDQRGGYGFRGRAEVSFTSCSLNEDELKLLKKEIDNDDFFSAYRMIEGATTESLDQLKEDLDDLLGEKTAEEKKKEEEKKKSANDNPFSALFSFWKPEKKDDKKDKMIAKDNDYEKVLRSQCILKARYECRKLYDRYKKVHGMPAFSEVIE